MPIDKRLRMSAEEKTNAHRTRFSDPLGHTRIEDYIRNILPLELQCAESDKAPPPRLPPPEMQNKILVLLVGFSIDPLLQSICAYKPKKVYLVLNNRYGEGPNGWTGQQFGSYIASFFQILNELNPLIPNNLSISDKEFIILDNDQPAHVFRKLRETLLPLLRNGESLVLDITGGKKSMVAGAFLFGAFAGVGISYVDFDEYDPQTRAPRGYTCRIGILPNPYETFRLREWERVRELYNRYMFRNAKNILDKIIPNMDEWFSKNEIDATQRLSEVMAMYELWDNGDYCGAFTTYQKVKGTLQSSLELPTAVEILGKNDYWPNENRHVDLLTQLARLEYGDDAQNSLYVDVNKLLIYAKDELAKVGRLIQHNEDYRSALLRAVGLSEVLLRARLLILIHLKEVEVAIKDSNSAQLPQYQQWDTMTDRRLQESIQKQIVKEDSVYRLVPALRYNENGSAEEKRKRTTLRVQNEGQEYEVWLRRISEAPLLDKDTKFLSELNKIKDLRNKSIHTYLPVPQSIAGESLAVTQTNLEEFEKEWATLLPGDIPEVNTESARWEKICEVCGITFLP